MNRKTPDHDEFDWWDRLVERLAARRAEREKIESVLNEGEPAEPGCHWDVEFETWTDAELAQLTPFF